MKAETRYSNAEVLVHFFALFYISTSIAGFLVQAFVTPQLLERSGLGVGLAGLPVALVGAGVVALAVPSLLTQSILRGADGVLSSTLFRSAYEPLYTPLPPERKRSVKALIDVLINRLGDGLGSLFCWALVLTLPSAATRAATAAAVLVSLATRFVAGRLRRGYVLELAASLRSGAVVLDEASISDQTTRLTLSRTMGDLSADKLRREIRKLREAALTPAPPEGDAPIDSERISRILPILASQNLGAHAMKVLAAFGTSVTGQLADALLDRSRSSPAVRRRLVRVIAEGKSAWAATALTTALDDPEFEVRRQVVRSLEEIASGPVAPPSRGES